MSSYTINRIQSEMTASGSHWWDKDTMRFFGTRVSAQVYQGPGGVYFVTSEKPPHGKRSYSVRQYHPRTKDVDTVGEFCELSRATAHRQASKLAAMPLGEQFTRAMAALDLAITGDCKLPETHQTCYIDINDARECGSRSIVYLSDGGYTRIIPRQYSDSGRFYLDLVDVAPSAAEDRRAAWRKTFKLQCDVSRVLNTEPAGDVAIVAAEAHHEPSEAEQLAIDIQRGGGRASATSAAWLIRLATRHHKLMEDYCNGVEIYDADGEPLPALAKIRAAIVDAAGEHDCKPIFSGDPRGTTVKLTLPNGATNDWGKEGWCIPTRD